MHGHGTKGLLQRFIGLGVERRRRGGQSTGGQEAGKNAGQP